MGATCMTDFKAANSTEALKAALKTTFDAARNGFKPTGNATARLYAEKKTDVHVEDVSSNGMPMLLTCGAVVSALFSVVAFMRSRRSVRAVELSQYSENE